MAELLLSFDIEEFDMPLEYRYEISFADQIAVSRAGTQLILGILKNHGIKATFFSTVVFARQVPDLIQQIVNEGHELASHGYGHSEFSNDHYLLSKQALEEIGKCKVNGFRMARMQPVHNQLIEEAGYRYNSSINPTYLPGRYNNFHVPRKVFKVGNVWQLPASVVPIIRFPLFWLSFHNLPLFLYTWLSKITLKSDGYLNIYFHPWEFMPINDKNKYNFPGYVNRNVGKKMCTRFEKFIRLFKNHEFITIQDFIERQVSKK
jgi:hypothetical protein